ncbi:hypothetical protein MMC18_006593 [Xylographa bjoerkii]|nr:hypothetical protein [Xylographa bjoerkii]
MAEPTLRSVHIRETADNLLFRGNAELAAGRPDQALRLYTKVLYDVSPGHVCAFLNRALAHIRLGYPELAVMDAYRAAVMCSKLRKASDHTFQMESQCRAIERYLQIDKLHYSIDEAWTFDSEGYSGPGWLRTELSRIVFAPDIDFRPEVGIPWDALEIRAIYRMSGALWHCGLGARSDALGLIEDTLSAASKKRVYKLTDRERWTFRSLGDEILKDCTEDLSSDRELTVALMKTKTTLVRRVMYPWDTHIPDLSTFKDVEQLETYADSAAKFCTVRAVRPTSETGLMLRLVAARDIHFDEIVLSEESLLQVITADPIATKGFLCDNCAAVMITSGSAQPKTSKQIQHSWPSSGASIATTESYSPSIYADSIDEEEGTFDSSQFMEGTQYTVESTKENDTYTIEGSRSMEDISFVSQAQDEDILQTPTSSRPPTPPPHSKLDLTPDFHHCNACFAAAFCCGDCLGFSGDYHIPLCNTGLEAYIRSTYTEQAMQKKPNEFSSLDGRLYVHPKARCLYDLLLVRIIAMAADQDVNALDLSDIRWLNGDLRSAQGSSQDSTPLADVDLMPDPDELDMDTMDQSRTLPWSFTNNVINPIYYLQIMDIDPFTHLDKTDGWVLNTLFAKIMHSTQITKGVRHAKTYDDIGKLVHEEAPAPKPVDEDVWVGSIHPVFSMIGLVDRDEGERSNVIVELGKGVKCFAPSNVETSKETSEEAMGTDTGAYESTQSGGTVCIRAGEYILRSSNLDRFPASSVGNAGDGPEPWIGHVQGMNLDSDDTKDEAGRQEREDGHTDMDTTEG